MYVCIVLSIVIWSNKSDRAGMCVQKVHYLFIGSGASTCTICPIFISNKLHKTKFGQVCTKSSYEQCMFFVQPTCLICILNRSTLKEKVGTIQSGTRACIRTLEYLKSSAKFCKNQNQMVLFSFGEKKSLHSNIFVQYWCLPHLKYECTTVQVCFPDKIYIFSANIQFRFKRWY